MGASIYLVSACTSGEEFVAAFRRYADKNGLFIPIGEPLPPGRRSRFAVTLRDGGVMIEGEAEIVSSARVPSVVHGRVGMTLRFVAPDDASRTTLGELEKARLAMKPAPPSVPPRPADIPAEPRPVPPPVQGRIDAVNALAECVAIGDVAALGPPLPPAAIPPPKTGPRFAVPAIPAGRAAPGTSPPGGLGVMPHAAAAPHTSTAPLPIAISRPDDRGPAEPPAIMPRATPQPDRLRSAERPSTPDPISGLSQTMTAVEITPGPTSDTMVAATPTPPQTATLPAEPRHFPEASGTFDRGPLSATMTAVPLPSPNPPSAPTEIGGPLAVPIDLDDDISARTQIHAGAPRPGPGAVPGSAPLRADTAPLRADTAPLHADTAPLHADARPTLPPADVTPTLPVAPPGIPAPRPNIPVPITVHGISPGLRPPAPALHPEIEIAEPTDISMPPEPPSTPSAQLRAEAGPSTENEATALARTTAPSAELEATTLATTTTPSTELEATTLATTTTPSTELAAAALAATTERSTEPPGGWSGEPSDEYPAEHPDEPSDEYLAEPSDEYLAEHPDAPDMIEAPVAQESGAVTHQLSAEPEPDAAAVRPRRTVIGVAVQPSGVLVPPAPPTRRGPVVDPDEPTGILAGAPAVDARAPTMPPGSEQLAAADEPPPSEPAPAAPAAIGNGLPSGDWTIALDPAAPDGWSPPLHAFLRHPLDGGAAAMSPPGPSEPAGDPPAPVPHLKTPPMSPGALAASAPGSVPARPPRPSEMAAVEPKVQIDPTLIEPGHAVPPDPVPAAASSPGLAGSAPEMAIYGGEPGREAFEAPALHMMMAVPQPDPYAQTHGAPAIHGGQVPGYAMDPAYQMMPAAMQPGLVTADGSGFGVVRYPPLPSQARRRHLIIMLASAVAAVLLGIAAMLMFRRPPTPVSSGPPIEDKAGVSETPAPGESPRVPATAPAGDSAPAAPAGAAPATPPAAAGSEDPGAAHAAAHAAAAPSAQAGECYAEVSSVPAGAEIVLDQTHVIGTTPQRVALPCGNPVELLVRKPRLVPATHTITPTPEGTAVQFVLVRQTFLVKVSSTPAGATVTLGSKSLGVTPTMVKVPAFEASTLNITKDGYEPETEKIAPRANGTAVHTVLKKFERRKPR